MIYDVVIIGGGPAGMMAAGRAGERGARVLLVEKNSTPGKKLLLTGHGRCNLTNTQADDKQAMNAYGANAKFLFSAFHKFNVRETIKFFADRGVAVKTEDNGRVFPESNQATDVLGVLNKYLEENKVEILFDQEVIGFVAGDKKIQRLIFKDNQEVSAKNFIIATGGKSYPGTGSSGDAYSWLTKLGHKINKPRPALAAISVKEDLVKDLEGLSLRNIRLNVYCQGKKVCSHSGEIIFTSDGISGPAIIDLSSRVGALLPAIVKIEIDLLPEIGTNELEKNLQKDFHESNNKTIKNYLAKFASPKLLPVILKMAGIVGEKKVNTITKQERQDLVWALQKFSLEVVCLQGFDKAMITAGGVSVKEIDPKTMRSRLYSNLYLAGEVLDLDGPSGGYNLQIAWSTGCTAGDSVKILSRTNES